MKNTISREQAEKEYDAYLDFKKISPLKREGVDKIEIRKTVVNSIMEGLTVINQETFEIKYTLCFPLKEVKVLTFKPRLTKGALRKATNGVSASDGDGRIIAYISELTGEAKNVLNGLDTNDYSFCESIALYFL